MVSVFPSSEPEGNQRRQLLTKILAIFILKKTVMKMNINIFLHKFGYIIGAGLIIYYLGNIRAFFFYQAALVGKQKPSNPFKP